MSFTVELPLTYELIAIPENNDYDEYRWSLLAWVLNLDRNLISKIRRINQPKNIKVVIISLQYLFQVKKKKKNEIEFKSEQIFMIRFGFYYISTKRFGQKKHTSSC